MPTPDATTLKKHVRDFLNLNTSLGGHYHKLEEPLYLFNTTIKYHYMLHVADKAKFLHPAKGWCFGGESFLKHVRRLVFKNSFGTPMQNIAGKVAESYLQALHIHFSQEANVQVVV